MISLNKLKVALIGGAGFIGHNIALQLQKCGAEVSIIDSLQVNNLLSFASSESQKNRKWTWTVLNQRLELMNSAGIKFYPQDARDYHLLSKVLTEIAPDVIIQLAAVSHANKSNKDPYSTFDHSLRTLENALDCARGLGTKHFIFFSSSMVYGNFATAAVTEDTVCNPLGIYGALKFAGEKIVIAYNQVFGLNYTIVRPSALYGERCVSRRVGQIFIENAIQGLDVTINGTGEDKLDFTYIEDLVEGVKCIIQNEKSRNEIFNLTYGSSRSISEMAQILQANFKDVKIHYEAKDSLMPDRGTLCMDKMKSVLGFTPKHSIDTGYVKYIQWYKSEWAKLVNK